MKYSFKDYELTLAHNLAVEMEYYSRAGKSFDTRDVFSTDADPHNIINYVLSVIYANNKDIEMKDEEITMCDNRNVVFDLLSACGKCFASWARIPIGAEDHVPQPNKDDDEEEKKTKKA